MTLTGPQQRRLIALARAGQSLKWTRTDDALRRLGLVRLYTGPLDGEFAELTSRGMGEVQRLVG